MFELVLAFSFSLIVVSAGLHTLFSFALGAARAGTEGYREEDDGVLSRRAHMGGTLDHCLNLLTSQEPTLNFLGGVTLDLTEKEGEALVAILAPYLRATREAAKAVQDVAEALERLEDGELSEEAFREIVEAAETAKQRRKITGQSTAPRVAEYLRPYLQSRRAS